MTQTPRLESVLESVVAAGMDSFYTALPGRVVSFDQNFCTAIVQPMVKRGFLAEDGERETEDLPHVQECPVFFAGGAGGQITAPVKAGDHGLLIFTSCSLDRYQATGLIVDPQDDRRNTLASAVFLHGISHLAAPPEGYLDDAIVLRGNVRLSTHQTTQSAVRGTDFANALNVVLGELQSVAEQLMANSAPLGPYPSADMLLAATALRVALMAFDPTDHLSATVELE